MKDDIPTTPLDNRIAVVTGASRGIGYETALHLAKAGAHVVALARTQGGLEDLDDRIRKETGAGATLVPVDLTDVDAIDRLGAAIYERWGRLDILIGNAGQLGSLSPLGHVMPKEFEKVMAVNVTANWRLIRSLDPLLRASDAGRVVFVTSGAARRINPYWGTYAVSKAALEALARTYAAECALTKVRVNLLSPGPVRTAMRALAMPGEDAESLPPPSALMPDLLAMVSSALDRQGELYDFPSKSWLAF